MRLFDTHAHLLDTQFNTDRNTLIPALPDSGVYRVLEACCGPDDIDKIAALVYIYDHVYGSVGVHPHTADTFTARVAAKMEQAFAIDKIVAIGEIGLDYHYDFTAHDVQREAFAAQLAIAQSLGKPVLVHDREAHGDCMELVRAHRSGLSGILHCYSGSYEDAKRYVDMGFLIAFGGSLTFKNATRLAEIAQKLPDDAIVIETDCPYMTPVPHRGKRNDPRMIALTARRLAELRGTDADSIAALTAANANRLFGLSE